MHHQCQGLMWDTHTRTNQYLLMCISLNNTLVEPGAHSFFKCELAMYIVSLPGYWMLSGVLIYVICFYCLWYNCAGIVVISQINSGCFKPFTVRKYFIVLVLPWFSSFPPPYPLSKCNIHFIGLVSCSCNLN